MLSRLTLVAIVFCCGTIPATHAQELALGSPLAGTQPLTWEGDLSARMVDDLHKFADRETAASVERRARHWQRDFASPQAYEKSIAPNRARLAKYLGVPSTPTEPRGVQQFESFLVGGKPVASPISRAVRWPTRDGRTGYGIHIRPSGGRTSKSVVIIVVDPHLEPVDVQRIDLPQRFAEAGLDVYVTTVVDRDFRHSVVAAGTPLAKQTNMSHREFIARQAFEMGRSLTGYEVCDVLSLVDALTPEQRVMAVGFGDGGHAVLCAAALDPRIAVIGVCGSFGSKQALHVEPIDREWWGFLEEFGDAELATMTAGRPLVVDPCQGFAYRVPTPSSTLRAVAAPGVPTLPTSEDAAAELQRADALVAPLSKHGLAFVLSRSSGDATSPPKPLEALFAMMDSPPGTLAKRIVPFDKPLGESLAIAGHLAPMNVVFADRRTKEMIEHTQALLRESEYVRKDYWKDADRASRDPAKWQASLEKYRTHLYDEVLGRFKQDLLPPNVRTRLIYDTPEYRGYDVVLDVFGVDKDEAAGGVWALGTLLVPKDLKPGEKRPVVVCQHGLEGKPEDTILPNIPGSNYYHMFAARLAERGFVVFSPQNPYIGKTHFRQLVRKLHPLKKTLWSVIVPQHQQITNWLASLEFVDPKRIGFYGLSYGGKTAMRVPALVGNYCLSICSGDFNEWVRKCTTVRDTFSYMGTHEYEMYEFDLGHTFNYAEMAYLIAPRPFMVERGHRDGVGVDEWVSYEYAKVRMLYADLKIPERTEIEYFDGPHEIHAVGTFDFLHRHLNWPAPK